MSGILGLYAFDELWSVSRFVYYGLMGLQHRGQEYSSITTWMDGNLYTKTCKGLVEDGFTESIISKLKGCVGCGCVSTSKGLGQPIIASKNGLKLILYASGGLIDADFHGLARFLLDELSKSDIEQAGLSVLERFKGGYSFVCITSDGRMLAARDPFGVKPLCVGGLGFDLAVLASESSALDVVGADLSRDIEPGEVFAIERFDVRREVANHGRKAYCSFEYVYYARPDSIINGIHVYDVRRRIGRILSEIDSVEADIVIGVPETAIPFAMAYSQAAGIPVEMGFYRTGRSMRTAIKPTEIERLMGVQLKLNPIRAAIRGGRVVLIDDSVVRGTTLRNTVYLLRKRGAKGVHVRIGSPAIKARCPYGTVVPPEDELIGRALTSEEIAEVIGADSFSYLPVDRLIEAIGLPRGSLCLGCFTGVYPDIGGG
ncbi:MAG: amidophosphoribosyltransferase [Candidatus Bathyarchaeia archaeon]